MEDVKQKKNNILTKISAINEKLQNIDEIGSLTDRNQISLILNNLLGTIKGCDEKLFLKPVYDNILSSIISIDSNISNKQYSINQSYLYELIKNISYLNNANGKQNLSGYQQAVNKNISLLESDIDKSILELNKLKKDIENESKSFHAVENNVLNAITNNKTEYEKQLKTLAEKYDKFIADYIKEQSDFQKNLTDNQNAFKTEYNKEIINLKEDISSTKTEFNEKLNKSILDFEMEKTKKLESLSNSVKEIC